MMAHEVCIKRWRCARQFFFATLDKTEGVLNSPPPQSGRVLIPHTPLLSMQAGQYNQQYDTRGKQQDRWEHLQYNESGQ